MLFVSVTQASAWYLELDNSDGDTVFEVWLRVEDGDANYYLTDYALSFHFDSTEVAWTANIHWIPAMPM